MTAYDIWPLTPAGAFQVAALERQCFSLPWTVSMILSELENPMAIYYAAMEGSNLLGYAGAHLIADEGYITNIATHPDHRRRGIAGALLRRLVETTRERGARFITLEVRRSNRAAQHLYERNGFSTVGVRRGYYEKPREDALLYTLFFDAP